MNFKSHMNLLIVGLLMIGTGIFISCDAFNEDLPECRLFVKFKYDYNMLSVCAFHKQVDKVELYVFDKDGKFLFQQAEEGDALATGNYQMSVALPLGEYKLMAWAGVHDSYDVPQLAPGASITELELKLKRASSLVIDKALEPLWYGEINEVNFTGNMNLVETINLIKNTNTVRFIFQQPENSGGGFAVDDYNYEILESNGYLDHQNQLKDDDELRFRPYYSKQISPAAIGVELNTMRLMDDRPTRFVVTEKATNKPVFNISLTDYFSKTMMAGRNWSTQEYFDRQDEWDVVFYFAGENGEGLWHAVQVIINDWTWHIQDEGEDL